MPNVFIENERADEAAVREAIDALDPQRLNELAAFAAQLLEEQEASK